MRSKENDARLRAEANDIIAAYNRGDDGNEIAARCAGVWDEYFGTTGAFSSDADVLELLWSLLREYGEEIYAVRAMGALAGVRQGPVLAKVDDSNVNEDSRYLLKYGKNITSQSGEDGILEKVFSLIGVRNEWCVEFGAHDGKLHSNTYSLIQDRGWNGVLIEADSGRFDELVENYRGNDRAHLLRFWVGYTEGKDTLDDVLAGTSIPVDPDLVSIDVDGNDWHIWHSLKKYRPRAVVIEFNPTVPNDVLFVQSRDPHEAQGCSLRALVALGKAKGYELACVTTYNAIFVVEDVFDDLGIEDNSIGAMYRPLMDGRIFHGYDAKIFTVGMDRLNWNSNDRGIVNRAIRPDELQLSAAGNP